MFSEDDVREDHDKDGRAALRHVNSKKLAHFIKKNIFILPISME